MCCLNVHCAEWPYWQFLHVTCPESGLGFLKQDDNFSRHGCAVLFQKSYTLNNGMSCPQPGPGTGLCYISLVARSSDESGCLLDCIYGVKNRDG